MADGKWVGLTLACTSSLFIGTSFVITKKGLNQAASQHGFEGDGFVYLKNATWWAGIITMVVGEVANFAAYAFAPAILVTPLGALSVLIGAVLGAYFLDERLGILGKIGCAICLLGAVIIVLHAPPDEEVETIDKLLDYALQPAFLFYTLLVAVFTIVMIYRVAPKHGRKNPLIYISICSTAGSISIMAVKGFGIALKLTLQGHNQFSHPSTYVFMIVVVVCVLTQMNYFNKALSQFSTSIVNPLYYVTFTTATLCASFLMFKGFNTSDAVGTISLLCGFLIIFSGVYLLNLSREDPDGRTLVGDAAHDGWDDSAIPTDAMTAFGTRRSMQHRRSMSDATGDGHSRRPSWNSANGQTTQRQSFGDRDALMEGFEIGDEGSDDEATLQKKKKAAANAAAVTDLEASHGLGRHHPNGSGNIPLTRLSGSGRGRTRIERETVRPSK